MKKKTKGEKQMAEHSEKENEERSIFRELGGWLIYILIII